MFFSTEPLIQLQQRLNDDVLESELTSSWCVACGEDEPATATCADETEEACFGKKPLFAEAHPRDGGERCGAE